MPQLGLASLCRLFSTDADAHLYHSFQTDTETAVELAGRLQKTENVCDGDDKDRWSRLLDKIPVSCWCRFQRGGQAVSV